MREESKQAEENSPFIVQIYKREMCRARAPAGRVAYSTISVKIACIHTQPSQCRGRA